MEKGLQMSFPSAFIVKNHKILPKVDEIGNGGSNRLLKDKLN